MIVPIPNLSECPICQARSDQIENLRTEWFCNGCSCVFIIQRSIEPTTGIEHGRIVRKLPAPHRYDRVTDVSGNVMTDP